MVITVLTSVIAGIGKLMRSNTLEHLYLNKLESSLAVCRWSFRSRCVCACALNVIGAGGGMETDIVA